MSYEGRVMSPEMTFEVIPDLGNTHAGQRDSGYSVVPDWLRMSRHGTGVSTSVASWDEGIGEPWNLGVYANQRLNLRPNGKTIIR
jgi:hypothetical protein